MTTFPSKKLDYKIFAENLTSGTFGGITVGPITTLKHKTIVSITISESSQNS